jgi:photosystem II stability/assembly factor-like uncharacterized protein
VTVVLSLASLGGWSFGQENPKAKKESGKTTESRPSQADPAGPDRLKELEKQVEVLQKELDSLRQPAAKPAATKSATVKKSSPSASASANAPEAKTAAVPSSNATATTTTAATTPSAPAATFKHEWLGSLTWRCVGPAAMGGRIVDIAVVDSDPCCFYVATASGGLFKTMNNGITFTPLFDHESTVSIGDVAVAPSNPDIVWLGTGEHNARNSVSWGDGVYKSTDGGKTWTNMGLKASYQIGRIAIHPRNPDIVYVGALGRLWGENEERGVFKTTDGGKTWEKVLYVDAKTGCVDLAMSPDDPELLIAAMYERQRGIYDQGDPEKRFGPGSALYRSVDGGKNWRKVTAGLPTVLLGRIGVTFYQKYPKVVYATIETEKIGTSGGAATPPPQTGGPAYMGLRDEDAEGGAKLTSITEGGPAEKAGLKAGDLVVELDGKPIKSSDDLSAQIAAHKSGDKVKLKLRRGEATEEIEFTFGQRESGGTSGASTVSFSGGLGGQRENVQDRQGPDGVQTGGVFKSTDAGETWTRVNSLNPRPFYYSQIRVDPNDDNRVYVLGVQAYRSSDGGKRFDSDFGRGMHSDHHALWIDPRDGRHMLMGGDGGLYVTHDRGASWEHVNIMAIGQFYHVAVDTRRPYRLYGGLQDNGSWGGPSATRSRGGPMNDDWITVGGGDGFTCQADPNDPDVVYFTSQYGRMGRINVRTGERRTIQPIATRTQRASEGQPPTQGLQRFRFNWKTPFLLSEHNSKIFYAAGNYVFKSLDRGDKLRTISPEITATDKGSASALAESPVNPDVLYVGTDDGALWVSQNGGHEWTNITANIKDVPARGCVATIEASRFKEGRAYVAIDAHRANSDAPFVLVTEDFGKTWSSLRANLPDGSARTLREDLKNEKLLYLGTEFGMWVSLDRGQSWIKLNNNLPTVAVHEIAQPATANEIVAATHGRSLWIADVTALRQLTDDVQKASAYLFKPSPAVAWGTGVGRNLSGHKRYVGENPPDGAAIHYLLSGAAKEVKLKVLDADGKTVRELRTSTDPGLHKVVWDLRRGGGSGGGGPGSGRTGDGQRAGGSQAATQASPAQQALDASEPAAQAVQQVFGSFRSTTGTYRVVLTVDGKDFTQLLSVEPDPQRPTTTAEDEVQAAIETDRDAEPDK